MQRQKKKTKSKYSRVRNGKNIVFVAQNFNSKQNHLKNVIKQLKLINVITFSTN